MIRFEGKWLRWEREDEAALFSIVGESAIRDGRANKNPTTLKLAKRSGIRISKSAQYFLEQEQELRRASRYLRRSKDLHVEQYPLWKKLFKHQRVCLGWMIGVGLPSYLLADQPGVGKTLPSIAWSYVLRSNRIMVITPNSAKWQWKREVKRWDPARRRITVIDGTLDEQADQIRDVRANGGWSIGHWQSLARESNYYERFVWDLIILDEAHGLRSRNTNQHKASQRLKAHNRLALTGHPYVNDPAELYGILAFLYPDRYSSYWRFFEQHIAAIPRHFGGHDIIGLKNPKLLRWEIGSFTIRRTKKKVFPNLPPITRIPRFIDMPKKNRKEYERLKSELIVELEGIDGDAKILTLPNVLARITRLRQYIVDPGLLGGKNASPKYPVVEEILEELDGPPVIFTSFREAAFGLRNYLGKGFRVIRGRQKPKQRDLYRRNFLKGKYRGLIVVTQAGGTALNLGRHGYVIFLDLPWSAMELEQAEGRVDRPEEGTGKLTKTTSYQVLVRGTYEMPLAKLIEDKGGMFSQLFSGEVPSLTRNELEEVLLDDAVA